MSGMHRTENKCQIRTIKFVIIALSLSLTISCYFSDKISVTMGPYPLKTREAYHPSNTMGPDHPSNTMAPVSPTLLIEANLLKTGGGEYTLQESALLICVDNSDIEQDDNDVEKNTVLVEVSVDLSSDGCKIKRSPQMKQPKANNKRELDDSVFFRTQSYITELCYIKFLPNLLIRWFMSLGDLHINCDPCNMTTYN